MTSGFWAQSEVNLLAPFFEYNNQYFITFAKEGQSSILSKTNLQSLSTVNTQDGNEIVLTEVKGTLNEINFEVKLGSSKFMAITVYPIIKMIVKDYVDMEVTDSIAIPLFQDISFTSAAVEGIS